MLKKYMAYILIIVGVLFIGIGSLSLYFKHVINITPPISKQTLSTKARVVVLSQDYPDTMKPAVQKINDSMSQGSLSQIFPNQKAYVIDSKFFYLERSGFASDYSYSNVLLDSDGTQLCANEDNVGGPQISCEDNSHNSFFNSIDPKKENLGLSGHVVTLILSTASQQ